MNNFILPYEVKAALKLLINEGFLAYIIGGATRNFLMGEPIHDFDITTDAQPSETMRVFSSYHCIETGIKHGTVTVIINNYQIEITTFRLDGAYLDCRRPESVSFSKSLQEDAARRDFTMNAIAYNESEGFIDFFGGKADIEGKIIRTVGSPDERFSQDALRIMRAMRFSSVLGFEIENNTAISIHKNKNALCHISKERIYSELCRLLCGNNVANVLLEFSDVFAVIIPEIAPEINYDQNNPNHMYTLYEHTARAVSYTPADVDLRLAMLLHDTGKPHSMTLDRNGISHFKGHPDISEKIAHKVLSDLRAPSTVIKKVCTLIKYHDTRPNADIPSVLLLISKIGIEYTKFLFDIQYADCASQSIEYRYRLDYINSLKGIVDTIENEGLCYSIKQLKISGEDLMILGFRKKQIGQTLDFCLNEVINARCQNNKDALIQAACSLLPLQNRDNKN